MTTTAHFEITATDKTAAAFSAVQGHLGKLEGTLNSLKNIAFGTAIGAGLVELSRKIYDATVQWQSWQYTMQGAGLSTSQTADQLKFLKDTSLELGIGIQDMGASFSRFLLIGKAAGMTMGETDADFKAAAEAMRVFHLTSNQSTRSWLALTEVMSMGTLHSRQFTQQLGRDWPGIGALIAQAMYPGENSLKRFMADMDAGKIGSRDFMDAFQKVMNTPAMQGALADAEDSLQASTGRLSTAFFGLFNQADSPALQTMIGSINDLSGTLNDPAVKQGFDAIVSGLAEVAKAAIKVTSGLGDIVALVSQLKKHNQDAAMEAERDFRISDMKRLAAKGLQGSAAYQRDEAMAIGANNYLSGGGPRGGSSAPIPASSASGGGDSSTGYTNNAGTPIPEDLAKMLYGPTGHRDTMQPFLGKTEIAMPPALQAAKPISLKVHFDAGSAEESLSKLTEDMQKTYQASLKSIFDTDKSFWQGLFSPINDAFSQTITGVIRGTETWKMGMHKMFASIEEDFVGKAVNMTTDWAASQLAQVEISKTTGMTKVAIAQMVGKESAAASLAADSKTILGSAWTAAANVYKSVSAIPFVGWILAPALAIAAAVEVAGFAKRIASAEGGWWQVPSDQMANIHKDEMVLPRHLAEPLRQNIEGGGTGGTHHHYHIAAMDARSMAEVFKRNPAALAEGLRKLAKTHHLA